MRCTKVNSCGAGEGIHRRVQPKHEGKRIVSYEFNITASTRHSVKELADWMLSHPFKDKWESLESEQHESVSVVRQGAGSYRCVISKDHMPDMFWQSWRLTDRPTNNHPWYQSPRIDNWN